ncbi:MAG: hypothetical protein RR983_16440, partial [Massilia sp.]
ILRSVLSSSIFDIPSPRPSFVWQFYCAIQEGGGIVWNLMLGGQVYTGARRETTPAKKRDAGNAPLPATATSFLETQ